VRLATVVAILSFLLFPFFSDPNEFRKQIPPPANADSAWAALARCGSRLSITPAANLEDIKWYETTEWEEEDVVDPSGPKRDNLTLGAWIPPDTILLARRVRNANGVGYRGWAVMHELAHHFFAGPPGFEAHPFVPFAFPCKLMGWQHVGEWNR
jgi:hypothetical protein